MWPPKGASSDANRVQNLCALYQIQATLTHQNGMSWIKKEKHGYSELLILILVMDRDNILFVFDDNKNNSNHNNTNNKNFFVCFTNIRAKRKKTKIPGVNFINVLRTNFVTIFWRQKLQRWNVTRESFANHFCTKNRRIKCWWNRTQTRKTHYQYQDQRSQTRSSRAACSPREGPMRPANIKKHEDLKRNIEPIGLFFKSIKFFSSFFLCGPLDLDFSLMRPARHFEFETPDQEQQSNSKFDKSQKIKLKYFHLQVQLYNNI